MKIKIEFYGGLKAIFSQDSIETTVTSDTVDIEHIYLALCNEHQVEPQINITKPILNDTFAQWTDTVKAGDVIGFFPPASGG